MLGIVCQIIDISPIPRYHFLLLSEAMSNRFGGSMRPLLTVFVLTLTACTHTHSVLHSPEGMSCPDGFVDMSYMDFSIAIDHERDGPNRMSYILPNADGTLHNVECAREKGQVDHTKCCDYGMLTLIAK
jgi:hypothetical protein